ncbi:MAG: hypothetical protein V1897_16060 [Pseudomonadota bacterium]
MKDKMDLDETGSSDSALRVTAEEKLGKSQDASLELGDKTSEAIIHNLRIRQIEMERQNEEFKRVHLELEASRSSTKIFMGISKN